MTEPLIFNMRTLQSIQPGDHMKKRNAIIVMLLCLLIGFGAAVQMKITDGMNLYVTRKTAEDYQLKIKNEKNELEETEFLIDQSQRKLLQDGNQGYGLMKQALTKELQWNKLFAATEAVVGEGVIITVDDGTGRIKQGEDINNLLVHDKDIYKIINELKMAGAEAISVNEQRISAMTAVSCAGYTVRINGKTYGRPFVIKAIGDRTSLTDNIMGAGGFGVKLQQWGVQFQIQSHDDLYIPEYKVQEQPLQYMKKLEGERIT